MKTVLVVDDEPGVRALVASVLEDGVRVVEAGDGEEGLELTLRLHPSFVVLDLHMPRMGGLQLLAAIRSNPALPQPAVLVLSGSVTPGDRSRLAALGANWVLEKPFSPLELMRLAAEALGKYP